MPFKINISHTGKSTQIESESEVIVGKKIGETIKGSDVSPDLEGYELEITGTSDNSGHPGFKGLEGTIYHRRLLTYGPGMHDRRKGIRLRKLHRGEEISLKTVQINTKVIKEGKTKFADLGGKPAEGDAPAEEKPAEEPAKEEAKPEEKKAE
jgi:small subunit ribosomal protein S6e